jgi:hypothetical protein
MNVIKPKPTTFSHSTALMYALKSSEYAQFVAGHGKQHVGFPGSCDIGAQNLPSMTGESQHDTSPQQLTSTYIRRLMETSIHPGTEQGSRPVSMILTCLPFSIFVVCQL